MGKASSRKRARAILRTVGPLLAADEQVELSKRAGLDVPDGLPLDVLRGRPAPGVLGRSTGPKPATEA